MVWISEIDSTKSVADLKTSYTVRVAELQTNFEVLDSEIASDLKHIINGDFKRRVFIHEEAAQKSLTERQVAWMIYEYFKVSDTDESVLDLNDILKVEFKTDNIQSFNARWDENIFAIEEQPGDEILDNFCHRQLQQSEQSKPWSSLYIQDTVQNSESEDNTRLQKMVVRYREQKIREKHISSRERQL